VVKDSFHLKEYLPNGFIDDSTPSAAWNSFYIVQFYGFWLSFLAFPTLELLLNLSLH
jgi:hypothetical protein